MYEILHSRFLNLRRTRTRRSTNSSQGLPLRVLRDLIALLPIVLP